MAKEKCIDVSTWQGDINWKKVKAAGYKYAIIRAGFGRDKSQVDNKFQQNYKNAKAAGVKVGAYWYSYAIDIEDAKKEAQACLSVLKDKSFDLPVFYDMEESSQTKLDKSTLTAMAKAFMDTVLKGGFRVGIYSNPNWFKNYLDYDAFYGTYYVWLAQYSDKAQYKCDMWQYTSTGKVDGISGNVDMNTIYSDKLVKTKSNENKTDAYAVVSLKALLMLANRFGVIAQSVASLNNVEDTDFTKALTQAKENLGLGAQFKTDALFVNKLYSAIIDSIPLVGDVNGDGNINIKDATALQKQLAGADEDE